MLFFRTSVIISREGTREKEREKEEGSSSETQIPSQPPRRIRAHARAHVYRISRTRDNTYIPRIKSNKHLRVSLRRGRESRRERERNRETESSPLSVSVLVPVEKVHLSEADFAGRTLPGSR